MGKKSASSSAPSASKGTFDPSMRIVVLQGEERFLIQEFTRQLIESLQEKFGEIEQFSFDGESVQPAAVLDELRSYGLMQRHKLVIIDNADMFLAGGKKEEEDEDGNGDGDSDEAKKPSKVRPLMEKYAASPVDDATLLMRAQGWRKGNLDKAIAKVGVIMECKPLSDGKAIEWCVKRVAKRYDTKIERDAAELLVARHGASLQHLDTELNRLSALTGPGKPITRAVVADNTVLSREEKAWEIQNAIATGDATIMLRKLHELIEVSHTDAVPLAWSACDLLRKIHAAAQLIRQGVPQGALFGKLKLWGDTGNAIIQWGQRLEPEVAAQLLQLAIDADRHNKSGRGEPVRNLEALMVTIADTVNDE